MIKKALYTATPCGNCTATPMVRFRGIKEEQGKLYFILDENKIPVNKNHAHSRWLLELAEKKHGTEGERSYSSAEQKKDGIPLYRRNLSFSLFGIFVLIAFVICLFPAFVTLSTEKELRMEKVIYPTSASLNDSYEVQAPKYKDTTKTLEVIIGTDEDYTYFLNVYGWEEERVNDLLALLATGEPLTVYGIGGTGGMTIYEAYDANGVQICAKEEEEARLALKQEERKAKFGLAVKILGGILLLHWFLWWNIHRIPLFLARLLIFCYDIPSRKFLETLPPKRERLRDLAYRRRVYAKDHFGLKDPTITETKIKPKKREPLPIPKEEELSPEVQAKVLRDIDKINKEADFLSNKYTVYLIFLIAICVFGVVAYLLKMLTVTP